MPAPYWRSAKTPEQFLRGRDADTVLNLLGALGAWRCLTTHQAASLVGNQALANARGNLISDLFAADLVHLTNPFVGEGLGDPRGTDTALQLGSRRHVAELAAHLTYVESLALTGNRAAATDPVHQRHDILSAELGIRVAEHLECGTVLGPHFSHPCELAPRSSTAQHTKSRADLTLVRGDGLRLAVELTSTIGERFEAKVRRWVQILAEAPLEDSGLAVIFVVAASDAALERDRRKVLRPVEECIAEETKRQPGSSSNRTATRIGIATWQEWFPAEHWASEKFAALTIKRPTGDRNSLWEKVDLWDPRQFTLNATDPGALRSVITNAALLGQTHSVLRHPGYPAALAAALVRRQAGALPTVEPQRDRSEIRVPGAGQGGVPGAAIPSALLGPTAPLRDRCGHPVAVRYEPESLWVPGPPAFGHRFTTGATT